MKYHIKCPHCGFEFDLYCEENDFNKDEILRCPCGNMAIVELKEV